MKSIQLGSTYFEDVVLVEIKGGLIYYEVSDKLLTLIWGLGVTYKIVPFLSNHFCANGKGNYRKFGVNMEWEINDPYQRLRSQAHFMMLLIFWKPGGRTMEESLVQYAVDVIVNLDNNCNDVGRDEPINIPEQKRDVGLNNNNKYNNVDLKSDAEAVEENAMDFEVMIKTTSVTLKHLTYSSDTEHIENRSYNQCYTAAGRTVLRIRNTCLGTPRSITHKHRGGYGIN